jgi:hypothetical protein
MKPISAIYWAAGLLLAYAVINTVWTGSYALIVFCHLNRSVSSLAKVQHDLINYYLQSAVETFVIGLLQVIIIVYARKLNKQTHVA